MNTINIENARKRSFQLVAYVNIEETLYLSSIPGFVDDVNNIRKAEIWESAKDFNPDEEW